MEIRDVINEFYLKCYFLILPPFPQGAQKNEILNDQKRLFGLIFGTGKVGKLMGL